MKIEYNLTLDEILNCTNGKVVLSGNGTGPLVFNEIFTDSREDFSRNAVFIALKGENFNGEDFVDSVFKNGGYCAVVSWDFLEKHDISIYPDKIIISVADPGDALGNIAKFYLSRFNLKKKIAVTGSCGKTTTKEMAYMMFSLEYGKEKILKNDYNYNNLIGVPKTIFELNKNHEYLILEIGTNKKGEIKKLSEIITPDIGAITNIGKSHLLEFKNIKGVFEEKKELALSLKKDSFLIINADDETLSAKCKYKNFPDVNIFSFGFGKQAGVTPDILCNNVDINRETGKAVVDISFKGKKYFANINFYGIHLIYDLLCALSIAAVCNIDIEIGLKAMEGFMLPKGRMQVIPNYAGGYILINDSYNSNPDSLKAALEYIKINYADKKKILVLGDMLELGDSAEEEHIEIGRNIGDTADFIFYKGDYSDFITKGLGEKGFKGKFFIIGNKSIFTDAFNKLDKKNSVVLVKGSRGMKLEEYFEEEIRGK
ncbi:MAG: UDP-N-acetylmuramoyl-tripeptide--D-alanyl-D-alanine ligase [Deltaproteobacteria bacterium]|nr:UDP-N-acetylmuramoyl-tripeptide--D-alanyl-D-alanine ligase [Deltaproteobacteria bacterium]